MLYCMNWLTCEFWTRTGGCEVDCFHGACTSSPSYWQQFDEHLQAPKPAGWILCSPQEALCQCIYIYIVYKSSVIGRIYTYIRNVVQYWWSGTPSHSKGLFVVVVFLFVFWGGGVLGWMSLFVFLRSPIVSCSMKNSLILGCLWPLVFVLTNMLILGIWGSAISHLPGCFAPGPSSRLSDSTWSHRTPLCQI